MRVSCVRYLAIPAIVVAFAATGCKGSDKEGVSGGGGDATSVTIESPRALNVDVDFDTSCNPKGGKVVVTARHLEPGTTYEVVVTHPYVQRGEGEEVARGSLTSVKGYTLSCEGLEQGAYKVAVSGVAGSSGTGSFDVYRAH
jgi:hypothetical protein